MPRRLRTRPPQGQPGPAGAPRGPAPTFATPEQYPALKERYQPTLATEGKVVPSCIHCHQIGDAERAEHLSRGALSEEVLFPYPHPKALGLVLDPAQRATVKRVEAGSVAEQSGLRAGDVIESLDGQPLLSIADVQWVLRGGKPAALTLALGDGWLCEGRRPAGLRRAARLRPRDRRAQVRPRCRAPRPLGPRGRAAWRHGAYGVPP